MRNDLAVSIFAEKIEAGEPVTVFGDGSVRRDYTHVSDICDGLLAAVWSEELEGEVINLGSGRPIRIDTLIQELERALGTTAKVEFAPASTADLALTHASMERAWELLGYQPKVSFEEGIHSYASWYKQRRFPRLAKETLPGQTAVDADQGKPRAQAS